MKPTVPLSKQSKKTRRQHHAKQRETWDVHPVTRWVDSKKRYNRKKDPHRSRHGWSDGGFAFAFPFSQRRISPGPAFCSRWVCPPPVPVVY